MEALVAGVPSPLLFSILIKVLIPGGFWFYEGEHAQNVKREQDGKVYHDFYKLPYHHIEYNDLHRIGEEPQTAEEETPVVSDIPVITAEELNAKVSLG